jgi:hypothetical protein
LLSLTLFGGSTLCFTFASCHDDRCSLSELGLWKMAQNYWEVRSWAQRMS